MWAAERGIALIVALLAIALFSAMGLGLALSSSTARLADHNHEEAVTLLNAAESALELACRDMAAIADWDSILSGALRSPVVDGPPTGIRTLPSGGSIDLTRLTNQLTCGLDTACTEGQRAANTSDRPWGADNPRWQLFLHAPLAAVASPRHRLAPYAVVWVGDDGRETDADPTVDGGAPGGEGRYVLRARAETFGPNGARRAIEAEIVRICRPVAGADVCMPGVRLQSWRVASAVP